MFSEIFTGLEKGVVPDPELLQRRFDLALTKKLGMVKLPPAFRMQDPKINPRVDHLLQAALLLGDRERCDMAISVLAAENAEQKDCKALRLIVEEIAADLIDILPLTEKERIVSLSDNLLSGFSSES